MKKVKEKHVFYFFYVEKHEPPLPKPNLNVKKEVG